jgi:hypothetical protein
LLCSFLDIGHAEHAAAEAEANTAARTDPLWPMFEKFDLNGCGHLAKCELAPTDSN